MIPDFPISWLMASRTALTCDSSIVLSAYRCAPCRPSREPPPSSPTSPAVPPSGCAASVLRFRQSTVRGYCLPLCTMPPAGLSVAAIPAPVMPPSDSSTELRFAVTIYRSGTGVATSRLTIAKYRLFRRVKAPKVFAAMPT